MVSVPPFTVFGLLVVVIIFLVIVGYLVLRDRSEAKRRGDRAPRGTMSDVVRPADKEKMLPTREYCWVSFDGNFRTTKVTHYDRTSQRDESYDDQTGKR